MAEYDVKNTAAGPRGLNTEQGYIEIDPGQALKGVDLSDSEYRAAKRAGYFEFGAKATAADDDADDGAGLPNNVPKLRKIAKDENIDVAGANTAADFQRLILAARAAKAADQGGSRQTDALDAMDDETLRETVQALTGHEAPAGADRATLLALARGQA